MKEDKYKGTVIRERREGKYVNTIIRNIREDKDITTITEDIREEEYTVIEEECTTYLRGHSHISRSTLILDQNSVASIEHSL